MSAQSFTTAFSVDQSPDVVYAAVTNVRGWWSEDITGPTDEPGGEFVFRSGDTHRSTQRVTALEPGRRVAWHVTESRISFVADPNEWKGTDVVFEIGRRNGKTELRFTHIGLVPAIACYGDCAGAWGFYVGESLKQLIESGQGTPARKK